MSFKYFSILIFFDVAESEIRENRNLLELQTRDRLYSNELRIRKNQPEAANKHAEDFRKDKVG